jgi:hypothetical protein
MRIQHVSVNPPHKRSSGALSCPPFKRCHDIYACVKQYKARQKAPLLEALLNSLDQRDGIPVEAIIHVTAPLTRSSILLKELR